MSQLLSSSLFETDHERFEEIADIARGISSNNWGAGIIGENIFRVVSNFARKKDIPLEILSYPCNDDELWALTLKKKGTIFVCINSELPVSKQIFAAAHELYHIYRYAENIEDFSANIASLLDSHTADECAQSKEDVEANAFAALLLMPELELRGYISLFGVSSETPSVDDILTLMDSFGIPYKAVVLRLYECNLLSKPKAIELLNIPSDRVVERSTLTGKAKRWMVANRGVTSFGSLLDSFQFNRDKDFLTESRTAEDEAYLKALMQSFEAK